jgi:hypothetical protein
MAEDRELRQLFVEDQALRAELTDRRGLSPWQFLRMVWSDWRRRRRLGRLVQAGALSTAEDYYHAAMLLQHSPRLNDYWRAHQLALRSIERGYRPARWLAAATLDRWLMAQRRPQKYGTQYVPVSVPHRAGWAWFWWTAWTARRVRLWDVDPDTTDDERQAWDVPPLAEALARADGFFDPSSTLRLGPTLATCQVGNLTVEVQDARAILATAPARPNTPPRAEPLRPRDVPEPVDLPPGLRVCRVGDVFGVAGQDSGVAATWRRQQRPAGQALVCGWRSDQPPDVRSLELAGRAAIWIGGDQDGSAAIVTSAGLTACWYVWGWLPRQDLLRLAVSLPEAS